MKKLFADQWVQLLAYTTLLSGALTALLLFSPRPATVISGGAATASAAPVAVAPAPVAAPSPPPVIPAAQPTGAALGAPLAASPGLPMASGSQSLVYAPLTAPQSGITMTPSPTPVGTRPAFSFQGAGVIKILKAKTPGRWLVDAAGAADADTAEPGEAVANAKDGDEILVRPGTYKLELAAGKKKVSIAGTGADRTKTVFENDDRNLIHIENGTLSLKNLTLRKTAGNYGEAIGALNSAVVLTDVRIEAVGNAEAVSLNESTLNATGVQFYGGRTAVDVRERSKAVLEGCSFEEHKTSLLVEGRSELALKSSTVNGGDMGIYATKSAKLTITGSKFVGQDQSGINMTNPGSSAEIVQCEFSGSKDGLWIYENATVTVRDSKFKDLRGEGIFLGESVKGTVSGCEFVASKTAIRVATHSTLVMTGGTVTGSNRHGVEADDASKINLTGTTFNDNGGPAVYIQRLAEGVLKDVRILKTMDVGLFVGESSSASLEKTTIDGSIKAGVGLGRDAKLKAVSSAFTGNGRCGLSLTGETATLVLSDVRVRGNDCGISFVEGGSVDSARGDFLGNKKGAFMFAEVNKSKISLTGAGNKTKGP